MAGKSTESIMGRTLRVVLVLLTALLLDGHPLNTRMGEAYSPVDITYLRDSYKNILAQAVENLDEKRLRLRASIRGYEGSRGERDFIDKLKREIEAFLKSEYGIELISFIPTFEPDGRGKAPSTPRIEFSFFMDERLSLPERAPAAAKVVAKVETVPAVKAEEKVAKLEEGEPEAKAVSEKKVAAVRDEAVRESKPEKAKYVPKPESELTEKEIKSREHNRAGIDYYKSGEYSLAFSEFIDAIITDPYNIQARFNLGVAYQLKERYGEAIVEFQKVLQIADLPRAHIMLGAVYIMQRRYEEAVSELNRVVFFEFDSDKVSPDGVRVVMEFAKIVRSAKEEISVRLDGHTDSVGSEEYNEGLSRRRAISVAMELISMNNVEPDSIFIRGQGEIDPIAPNSKKLGRALNRRVEIMSR